MNTPFDNKEIFIQTIVNKSAFFLLAKTHYGRIKLRRIIKDNLFIAFMPITSIFRGYLFLGPRFIGIEPTNRCNLNCIMCVRRYWDKKNNELGDMSFELFRNKILPFLTSIQTINLQCLGEPLLGEYFFEMSEACKSKGCKVVFTTNGTMLNKYAQRIVEIGIDLITISIDGISSLKQIRNTKIDIIIDGICEIESIKIKLKKNNPELSINFVAMKDNISDLSDLIDLAYRLKIKDINVSHAVIHSEELFGQSLFQHIDIAKSYFVNAHNKAKRLGIQLNLPPLKETVNFCHEPFGTIYINWNGDVRPCGIATINEKNTLKLGNLNESSLAELWNNLMIRKLRSALLINKRIPEFCKSCSLRVCTLKSHTRIM